MLQDARLAAAIAQGAIAGNEKFDSDNLGSLVNACYDAVSDGLRYMPAAQETGLSEARTVAIDRFKRMYADYHEQTMKAQENEKRLKPTPVRKSHVR